MDEYPDVPLMAYGRLEPLLHNGDLLLCSGSSAMSKMIQAATDSVWSHIGMVFYTSILDRWLVIESVESIGVRAVVLRSYVENYSGSGRPYPGRLYVARHAHFLACAPDQVLSLSQSAVDLLGQKYDQQEILNIALRIVSGKLGLNPRAIKHNDSFICSELVFLFLQSIGADVAYNPANFIAPADFAQSALVTILWEIAFDC